MACTIRIERHLMKLGSYKAFLERQRLRTRGAYRDQNRAISDRKMNEAEAALCEDLAHIGSQSVLGLLDECITARGRSRLLQSLLVPLKTKRPFNQDMT